MTYPIKKVIPGVNLVSENIALKMKSDSFPLFPLECRVPQGSILRPILFLFSVWTRDLKNEQIKKYQGSITASIAGLIAVKFDV